MSESYGMDWPDGAPSTMDDQLSSGIVPQKKSSRSKTCKKWLRSNILVILLVLSIVAGIGLGVGMRSYNLSKREQMYFQFPGELLMRMLKAMIIPLITSSLIAGLGGLDSRASGKLGLYAILYYMATTVLAVMLGILLVMTIKPGARSSGTEVSGDAEKKNIADSFLDLIRNIFPDNIVEACFRNADTKQISIDQDYNDTGWTNDTNECPGVTGGPQGGCNITEVKTRTTYDFDVTKKEGMNVLGLVVFAVAIGIATSILGEVGKPLYHFANAVAEASMKLVAVVIWYSPIGILFLVASEIIGMDDPMKSLEALGLYMVTVISGLFIHGFIVIPLLYAVIVRKNPYRFMAGLTQAMFTALGTASSSATLPITYKCLEENNHIDQHVTRFVLPVGATINMDGTALYEAVAAIFIAQTVGRELTAANVVTTSITATLASIGAASVPGAGLITMIIVLEAIGLPAKEVTKILAVDWFLDRIRTMINVEGDSFGSGIVAHLSRKTLAEMNGVDDEKSPRAKTNDPEWGIPDDQAKAQKTNGVVAAFANHGYDGSSEGTGPPPHYNSNLLASTPL